jgi:HSP20 family protein
MVWWKRDRWKRIFDEMFREFEEIDEMFERMMRSVERMPLHGRVEGPYFYGFSVTLGPDGKPKIREFGNVKPLGRSVIRSEVREPFVDVVYDEQNNQVNVIAEMPGVSKESINIEASEDSVHIHAEEGNRKYDTTVNLETQIDPKSAKATFNNGVLQVTFKSKKPMRSKGVRIKVE